MRSYKLSKLKAGIWKQRELKQLGRNLNEDGCWIFNFPFPLFLFV